MAAGAEVGHAAFPVDNEDFPEMPEISTVYATGSVHAPPLAPMVQLAQQFARTATGVASGGDGAGVASDGDGAGVASGGDGAGVAEPLEPAASTRAGLADGADGAAATPATEATAKAAASGDVCELVVIGAGPHSLTLMLRLLEEDPDLLDEGLRAKLSMDDPATVANLGSWPYVKSRVTATMRSASARADLARKTVRKFSAKAEKAKSGKKNSSKKSMSGANAMGCLERHYSSTPVKIEDLKTRKVRVIDQHGAWMSEWHKNFEAYRIPHLRSAADVHPGPHDMRELLAYAHITHRNLNSHDLVNMISMERDNVFKGPYALPSTSIFHDYCKKLITSYDIEDAVDAGYVEKVQRHGPSLYELYLGDGTRICTKRVVCALGPNLRKDLLFWEHVRRALPATYVLHL